MPGREKRCQPIAGQFPGLVGKPKPLHPGLAAKHGGNVRIHDFDSPHL